MELYRLIYTSSRRPACTDEEIEKILASCKKNNPKKNITGILLHSGKRFIQYLEGDKNEIRALYEGIKSDVRHGGVNERDFAPIDKRIFPSWEMGYKDLGAGSLNFNTDVSSADKEVFNQIINDKDFDSQHGLRVLKTFFEMA